MKKRALISVFVKDGILDLANALKNADWEILSTGGTAKFLTQNGINVTDVSDVTGFPECLDGRVKTLHPKIHAGILAMRENADHMKTIEELGVTPIDMICVNLYPFFDKVQAGLTFEETVEFIDIGGPTMLRAAAKNFQDVIVLTDPADYAETISAINAQPSAGAACVSKEFKRRLAGKVFNLTSAYDAAVSRFMLEEELPTYYDMPLVKSQSLRYGENPHQKAAFYKETTLVPGSLAAAEQLHGKELSYNNINDANGALDLLREFDVRDRAAVIAVKHANPCGVGLGSSVLEAYLHAYNADPVSIFGGIIACNREIDADTAREISKIFLEIVIAPSFTDEALEIIEAKKNIRILSSAKLPCNRIIIKCGLICFTKPYH